MVCHHDAHISMARIHSASSSSSSLQLPCVVLFACLVLLAGSSEAAPVAAPVADTPICTQQVFPCFRTRYVDLVLDFMRNEDFTVNALPTTSRGAPAAFGGGTPRSLYRDALRSQASLPFLQNLCMNQAAPLIRKDIQYDDVLVSNEVDGSHTQTISGLAPTAAVTSSVQTFLDYQNAFQSQSIATSSSSSSPSPRPINASSRGFNPLGVAGSGKTNLDQQGQDNRYLSKLFIPLEAASAAVTTTTTTTTSAPSSATTTTAPSSSSPPSTSVATTTTTTTAAPTVTTAAPTTPTPVSASGTVLYSICQHASYHTVVKATTTTLDNTTLASFSRLPGVRLLSFRAAGGQLVLPYAATQYLVTLAVVSTGAGNQKLVDTLSSVAASSPTSIKPSSSNNMYRACGLAAVYLLQTSAYESLYMTTDPNARVSLYSAVGFGNANSSGLSIPWILLLVAGTTLLFGVTYAVFFRRKADRHGEDEVDGQKTLSDLAHFDELGGRAKKNEEDDDDDDAEQHSSEDEELNDVEMEQQIQHNMETVWEEKDLRSDLYDTVSRNVAVENAKKKYTGGRGGDNDDNEFGAKEDDVEMRELHASNIVSRRNGQQRRGFARVQLLPGSSLFEEAFETSPAFALPPEFDEDETAFERRLKRMHERDEQRRKREEEAMLRVSTDAAGGFSADKGGGAKSGTVGAGGDVMGKQGTDTDLSVDLTLPPEAHQTVSVDEGLDEAAKEELRKKKEEEERRPKPMGLAARRMATMMSNMKFAAVPYGALRLPSQHEINRQLTGGSAAAHMAMAAETNDIAERLTRQRFSKLYFAPQALVDQLHDSDSEGSNPSSPTAGSPDATARRFQAITEHLQRGGGTDASGSFSRGENSPSASASPPARVASSSAATSSPPRPLKEHHQVEL